MNTASAQNQPADDARAVLDSLAADQGRLADRAVAPALWYYPALAIAAATLVAAPALGGTNSVMVLSLTSVAFVLISLAHRKQTGVAVRYSSTPRSLSLALVLCAVIAGLTVASFVLEHQGAQQQIVWTASAAFVVMLVGSVAADRVHRAELRRVR